MSFQGDVAGIGLGELLQGLSRGGRDGVLTLNYGSLHAVLGLQRGQIFILPAADEEEKLWRRRSEDAWGRSSDAALETSRRKAVAQAGRLENIYRMLAAPNLHFRFEEGPLPPPPHGMGNTWGQGTTAEFLLLEYARMADERSTGSAATLAWYDLPRALDPGQHAPGVRDFLEQCDGSSTIQEIADRLGWSLSQCLTVVGEHIDAGNVRVGEPRELLAAAQHELGQGLGSRAATRLTGWIQASAPGPPMEGDDDLLLGEWQKGRLQAAFEALEAKHARALLRKLDAIDPDRAASHARWNVAREVHRGDELIALHEAVARLVSTDHPDARTFHDLLRIARALHERGCGERTRTLLRLAASHLPSRPQTRVELGKRMLETGLIDEGVAWLLDTARELSDLGKSKHAIVPIRAVLRALPEHEEANALLIEVQELQTKRRRRRVGTLSAATIFGVVSLVALVRHQSRRHTAERLAQIEELREEPGEALAALDRLFSGELPSHVADLREELVTLKHVHDTEVADGWLAQFARIATECATGDPLRGLDMAIAMEESPDSLRGDGNKERQDLFGIISRRVGELSRALDLPTSATEEELAEEKELCDMLAEMLNRIDPETAPAAESSFHFRITELLDSIERRRKKRAAERAVELAERRERNQNNLLDVARAHDRAGDLERSLQSYEKLLETDPSLGELPELQSEIEKVRAHLDGVRRANELSMEGEHEAAEAALRGVCPRPIEHLFPWKIESRPSGARVVHPGGEDTTPFVAKSGFGERVDLRIEAPGCEPKTITITKPQDLVVYLHRFPERVWKSEHRVKSAPVAVGDDHIVADRLGRIIRLDRDSKAKWEVQLPTLGGVARTPVFLPQRPGHFLILTEDGHAWLIDSASGQAQGPRDIGSPPRSGPTLTRGGVTASFADGRIAVWTRGLEPNFYESDGVIGERESVEQFSGANANLAILRNQVGETNELVSEWTGWKARIEDAEYRIEGPSGANFSAERHGVWTFIAWESPKALLPQGRLWVSDEAGLRSYLP